MRCRLEGLETDVRNIQVNLYICVYSIAQVNGVWGDNLVMITIRWEVKGTKSLPITHSFGRSTTSTGQTSGRALANFISDIDTRR